MSKTLQDRLNPPCEQIKMSLNLGTFEEALSPGTPKSGKFIFDMRDEKTGEQLAYWEKKNLISLDAGLIAARLFKNSETPVAGRHNGINMLAVGTGATGNILSPDAPQATQRRLNTEIARKAFSSSTYRTAGGVAVAYPTNIVDFTCTFGASEAVGALNEMALMRTTYLSGVPAVPIPNQLSTYDPTFDVTGYDVLINYLPFMVIGKPSTAILSLTWRLVF